MKICPVCGDGFTGFEPLCPVCRRRGKVAPPVTPVTEKVTEPITEPVTVTPKVTKPVTKTVTPITDDVTPVTSGVTVTIDDLVGSGVGLDDLRGLISGTMRVVPVGKTAAERMRAYRARQAIK